MLNPHPRPGSVAITCSPSKCRIVYCTSFCRHNDSRSPSPPQITASHPIQSSERRVRHGSSTAEKWKIANPSGHLITTPTQGPQPPTPTERPGGIPILRCSPETASVIGRGIGSGPSSGFSVSHVSFDGGFSKYPQLKPQRFFSFGLAFVHIIPGSGNSEAKKSGQALSSTTSCSPSQPLSS